MVQKNRSVSFSAVAPHPSAPRRKANTDDPLSEKYDDRYKLYKRALHASADSKIAEKEARSIRARIKNLSNKLNHIRVGDKHRGVRARKQQEYHDAQLRFHEEIDLADAHTREEQAQREAAVREMKDRDGPARIKELAQFCIKVNRQAATVRHEERDRNNKRILENEAEHKRGMRARKEARNRHHIQAVRSVQREKMRQTFERHQERIQQAIDVRKRGKHDRRGLAVLKAFEGRMDNRVAAASAGRRCAA